MVAQKEAQRLTEDTSGSAGPKAEAGEPSAPVRWRPRWLVDVGQGEKLGLTIDDGCFVVLYPTPDNFWRSGTHIPPQVAERIAQLVSSGVPS